MKKMVLPLMLIAFLIAFYNQESGKNSVFITVIAVVIFMFGMMKLSAKTPSKNQEKEDAEI